MPQIPEVESELTEKTDFYCNQLESFINHISLIHNDQLNHLSFDLNKLEEAKLHLRLVRESIKEGISE